MFPMKASIPRNTERSGFTKMKGFESFSKVHLRLKKIIKGYSKVYLRSILGPFKVHSKSIRSIRPIKSPSKVHLRPIQGPLKVHLRSIHGPLKVNLRSILYGRSTKDSLKFYQRFWRFLLSLKRGSCFAPDSKLVKCKFEICWCPVWHLILWPLTKLDM